MTNTFPIDLSEFQALPLDPSTPELTDEQRNTLRANIQLCRDAIVFFTAVGDAKGLGGHTGGAYDTVPEVMIAYGFMLNSKAGNKPDIYPVFFDESGHRVATQYLMAVLEGELDVERLLHYREYEAHMPGHPEREFTPGVKFSSGRLGHLWPFVNGVAMANPESVVLMLGSDGSQMEGNDAEAARLAVAQKLNVKLLIDDNDVTIAGHPSEYMQGFDVARTLEGHGVPANEGDGEDLDDLYRRMCQAVTTPGPRAVIIKRKMAVGIEGLEGSPNGHDVIKTSLALTYLEQRGCSGAVEYLKGVVKAPSGPSYRGSSGGAKNRDLFGKVFNDILSGMTEQQRLDSVRVFDSDLEGSCGLHHVRKTYPEIYISGGIMERGNYSAAAGFGYEKGKQGVFGTFSAFLEMVISEITMARLNKANVLAHFSHSGVDDMADNTCHFGINNMFADNGLSNGGNDNTRLYFPADQYQFKACLQRIFGDPGCRFIFSTRSAVPDILDEEGQLFYKEGYAFEPGRDDIIRDSFSDGCIVSYGECLYRALDAVTTLSEQGQKIGLVNKATLNVYDGEMMSQLAKAPWVLVVESQNVDTGLGSRFGTALLERGFKGRYKHLGTHLEGCGGLWQQLGHQGLDPNSIIKAVSELSD